MTVYLDKYLDTVLTEKTCGAVSLVCVEDNFSAKCLNEQAGFSQAHKREYEALLSAITESKNARTAREVFQNKCAVKSILEQLSEKAQRVNPTGSKSTREVSNCQPVPTMEKDMQNHLGKFVSELFVDGEDANACPTTQ